MKLNKKSPIKVFVKFLAILSGTSMAISYMENRMKENMPNKKIHKPYGPYEEYFKRPLDLAVSFIAIIVLFPIFVVTALLIKVKLGEPIIFMQERPGLNEKVFRLYKFRTMTDKRGEDGELLPDKDRLINFGKKLRSSSLDELPEFFNILLGDMSLVGPRPLLVKYLSRYNERQRHRHDVRPGLTGLAQISGRNGLSWEEKFEHDVRYTEKITFIGDIKIIIRTIAAVFKGAGISSGTSVTMEEFEGNKE